MSRARWGPPVAVLNGDVLTVNGEVVAPSGNVSLSAGTIVIAANGSVLPVIEGRGRWLRCSRPASFKARGVINAGTVGITATGGATLSGGIIEAVTGPIGITAPQVSVDANETIVGAAGIGFSGNVTLASSSFVGSNASVTVGGLLTDTGGILSAVGDLQLGGVAQIGGVIEAGGSLYVGGGTGIAGWAGSSATSGTFSQSGGLLAVTGDANIFTTGTFSLTGGTLAVGGTLGATATHGIDIGGTVSAAGPSTGFMFLAIGGNAVLETTGLLAGPSLTVTGDPIPGNAFQAPAGTVLIAGTLGTHGFAGAASVGSASAASGYALFCPVAHWTSPPRCRRWPTWLAPPRSDRSTPAV